MEAELVRLEFRKAQTKKYIASLELSRAKALLAQRTIRSSIDGVVVERYVSPGESGKDQALFKIAQVNPLRVEVSAPARRSKTVKPGDQALIMPDNAAGNTYPATVAVVDKVLDSASGTFYIRLSLPNEDQKVKVGTRC